jgi:mycothiol synthase
VLRPLRESDADEVVAVYRRAFGDARPIDAAEIGSWFRNPEIEPDALRVLEVDGRVAGYGDLEIANDEVALEVAAPGYWDVFLEWAEESARAAAVARVRTQTYSARELVDAATRRGYRLWRSAFTMQIELGDLPPEVRPTPVGIEVCGYRDGDAEVLRQALDEAFAVNPFFHAATPSYFREFYLGARGFDPALWLLAWDGTELAGFVLAFPEHLGDKALGWIGSIGVRPRWRGRGLGESLLVGAFCELHARGLRTVGLGVDSSNETGALRLYERVGMRVVRRAENWVLDL